MLSLLVCVPAITYRVQGYPKSAWVTAGVTAFPRVNALFKMANGFSSPSVLTQHSSSKPCTEHHHLTQGSRLGVMVWV